MSSHFDHATIWEYVAENACHYLWYSVCFALQSCLTIRTRWRELSPEVDAIDENRFGHGSR